VADGHDEPTPAPPGELPEVLDLDEAAAMLKIRPRTLSDLAAAGKVPGRKIGRAWRFSRPMLHEWLGTKIDAPAERP
jgi:excisionase family DNA binding protein